MTIITNIENFIDDIHKDLHLSKTNLTIEDYDNMLKKNPQYNELIQQFDDKDIYKEYGDFRKNLVELKTIDLHFENDKLKKAIEAIVNKNFKGERFYDFHDFE